MAIVRRSFLLLIFFIICQNIPADASDDAMPIGKIRDIRDDLIVVSMNDPEAAKHIQMGDVLFVHVNGRSISLTVSYPMMTLVKCKVSQRLRKDVCIGLRVYKKAFEPIKGKKPKFPNGYIRTAQIDDVQVNMAFISGGRFKSGISDDKEEICDATYWIGTTEVTYKLWVKVIKWARSKGYTFSSLGKIGSSGSGSELQPVTCVSWQDAIVWCNACTEYLNESRSSVDKLGFVYYYDAAFKNPVKSSFETVVVEGTRYETTYPFIRTNAKGVRLPTGEEWEYAARYIKADKYSQDIVQPGYQLPGNFPSGVFNVKKSDFDAGEVAWFKDNSEGVCHEVGLKKGNNLGLFDMSGNVWEWTSDESMSSGGYKIACGGGFDSDLYYLQVGLRFDLKDRMFRNNVGFRISMTD